MSNKDTSPDFSWIENEEIPELIRGAMSLVMVSMIADPDHLAWRDHTEYHRLIKAAMAMIQNFQSDVEEIFPPEEPGSKKEPMPDALRCAVCDMLDAAQGLDMTPETLAQINTAYQTADAEYFRTLAAAADHINDLEYNRTKYANSVREARSAFADLLLAKGKVPANFEVRDEVIKRLGMGTWSAEESSRWSPVFKAAGLYNKKRAGGKKKHSDRYSSPD